MLERLNEIREEAERLRKMWKTWEDLERLDLLERMLSKYSEKPTYSKSAAPSTSDFAEAAYSVSLDKLVSVLDEHMNVIMQVYPKEYDAIMRKLK